MSVLSRGAEGLRRVAQVRRRGDLHLHIGEQRDRAYVAENLIQIMFTVLVAVNSAKCIFPTNYDV